MRINTLSLATPISNMTNGQEIDSLHQKHRQEFAAEAINVAQTTKSEMVDPDHQLQEVVNNLNKFIHGLRQDITFTVEESGLPIVRVFESESGRLLRNIPAEAIFKVSRLMAESLAAA
jgi:uncharacterized FlaG/YvyC family protein